MIVTAFKWARSSIRLRVPLANSGISNTPTGVPSPYANYYWGTKQQYLILASELSAMGMSAGEIKSLAFDVLAVNSCPHLTNFEIKLKNTTTTNLTSTWEAGLTSVYSSYLYLPFQGWNTHNFSTPFVWDGLSNIIVETCFNNNSWITNANASVFQINTAFASTHDYHADNATVCSSSNVGSTYNKRPNIRFFAESGGCSSDRVPIDIIVTTPSACDVGVFNLLEPVNSIYLSSSESVKAVVKNYGTTAQNNIPVSYQINKGTVVTDTITTTINPGDSLVYTFVTTADFSTAGNTYSLKLFTALACDTVQINDTIWRSVKNMMPNYCPSNASSTLYNDIENLTFGGINNTSQPPFNKLYTDYIDIQAFQQIQKSMV